MLDNKIQRLNVEAAKQFLLDMHYKIHAVWVVSRPVQGLEAAEHWCIKIHGGEALVSVDFFEYRGCGAFGISSSPASKAEVEEFLFYTTRDKEDNNKKK